MIGHPFRATSSTRFNLDLEWTFENIRIKIGDFNSDSSSVPNLIPGVGPKIGGLAGVQLDIPGVGIEGFAAGAALDVGGTYSLSSNSGSATSALVCRVVAAVSTTGGGRA